MQSFGNERIVQQGEEWNLDVLVSQSDKEYIPFIISSQRQHPFFAITVASTKFEKNERYVATWWLDLINGDGLLQTPIPRFYQTVVDTTFGEVDDNTPLVLPEGDLPMHCLYQYTKASDEIDNTVGHKPYHYVYFTEDDPYNPKDDYECRIRMQFKSQDTAQWGSQNYMYQITLVDTIPMADYVQAAKESYPDLDWPTWVQYDDPDWDKPIQELVETDEDYKERVLISWTQFRNNWIMDNITELFHFIKNRIPNWFTTDIDVDSLVGKIDSPQIIMSPTKLQVNNNLRKLI